VWLTMLANTENSGCVNIDLGTDSASKDSNFWQCGTTSHTANGGK